MMNGRIISGLLIFFVMPFSLLSFCFAGNREMVEKSVQELKDVNEEALSQISNKPSDGKITLKSTVSVSGGKRKVEIKDYSIARTKGEVPEDGQSWGTKDK